MKHIKHVLGILLIMGLLAGCSDDEVEITGIIELRPVSAQGTWIIDGVKYRVPKKVELDDEKGPLGIGACVEIELEGGVVKEIETKDPDECRKEAG